MTFTIDNRGQPSILSKSYLKTGAMSVVRNCPFGILGLYQAVDEEIMNLTIIIDKVVMKKLLR